MILVFSHPGDDHAAGVLSELSRWRHPAALIDSSQFPSRSSLTQSFSMSVVGAQYRANGTSVDLRDCRAAWWRRPLPYTLHDNLDPNVMSFAYTECHEAFSGVFATLDTSWVNPPHLDERAHHKPLQLATAVRVGLAVPRTLITNDPDDARRFISELGPERTIYKTFVATEEHWRETRVLLADEMNLLEAVRFAPVIFQEYIAAATNIRVTIVGEEMFAAAIRSNPKEYSVDYRMNMAAATFAPFRLSDTIAERLRDFMRELGIIYGAVDLMLTDEGQHFFLEVNPAGEWCFVEERTGQPITAAMASLLVRLDTPKGGQHNGKNPHRSRRHRTPT